MARRTITSPYSPKTQAEMRAKIGTAVGQLYADMDAVLQTEVNAIIDNSFEYVSKRLGHEPWAMHTIANETLASGTATAEFAAAVRQVITIVETYDSQSRKVTPATRAEYLNAWGDGNATHPWAAEQRSPYWFFDGMTDSNPPQQQWRRVPTPDATVTYEILCRPYFTIIDGSGDGTYVHMPANAYVMASDYQLQQVYKLLKNFETSAIYKASLEDEIAANLINDNPEGGWEAPRKVGLPADFVQEMEGP